METVLPEMEEKERQNIEKRKNGRKNNGENIKKKKKKNEKRKESDIPCPSANSV